MRKLIPLVALSAVIALPLASYAQKADATTNPAPTALSPLNETSKTTGTVVVEGQTIHYEAVAGTITVGSTDAQNAALGPNGEPLPGTAAPVKNPLDAPATAKIFYVAYFKQGADVNKRPITFFYNGGPGSSTVWLHMGAFGPRRVSTPGDTHLPAAPYSLVNNNYSLLDATDLVFIDAPGTGFSRIYGQDAPKAFWGVDQDANAFARFINRFVSRYDRWNSPKYLFGESYGTTRSAVLSQILTNNYNMDLNGVILLSQVLNYADGVDQPQLDPDNDNPYFLSLPSYAAIAWYHHKVPNQNNDLEGLVKQAETYAMGEYMHALSLGDTITPAEKQAVAQKLYSFTGIPADYWVRANLRVNGGMFEKELQVQDDLTTGRLDARFSGPTIDPMSESAAYDPQSAAISSAYVSLFNQYVRNVLHFGNGLTYQPEANFGDHVWDMQHTSPIGSLAGSGLSLNVMPDLAFAMKSNPKMKVMLNVGYYDLATPFFAALFEEHHLNIPSYLDKNITYEYYRSGHMVYVNEPSLHRLHDNVAAFIGSTDAGNQ